VKWEPHPDQKVIPGGIPKLVSLSLYERAQMKLATNRQEKSHQPHNPQDFLLKGHIFCACCKYNLVGQYQTSKGVHVYPYYRCMNYRNKYAACEDRPSLRTSPIDQIVWEECCCLFERLDLLQDAINKYLKEHISSILATVTTGQDLLFEREQEIFYAREAQAQHPEGSYTYNLIAQDIQSKEEQMERYREEVSSEGINRYLAVYQQRIQEFLEFLQVMQGDYQNASFQQKRNALEVLGVQISVKRLKEGEGKQIEITYSPHFAGLHPPNHPRTKRPGVHYSRDTWTPDGRDTGVHHSNQTTRSCTGSLTIAPVRLAARSLAVNWPSP